jgi:outer membrane protein assembly factor BamB
VFLMDHSLVMGSRVTERLLALDERSGAVLWQQEWPADYRGLDYNNGPRATPTVDGDRVYALGAMGRLGSFRVTDGTPVWTSDLVKDFRTTVPGWGMASAPLVVGSYLITVVAGAGNAKVVAFDKLTGKVNWRALSSEESEPGYSQPVLIHEGKPQVVVWHTTSIDSLDPNNGELLWSIPFRVTMNTPIATPAWKPPHLIVSSFFDGARLLELTPSGGARLLWSSRKGNEIDGDKFHALMSQPIIEDGYIYGISNYGQLRCLRLTDGERMWETQAVTVEKARNASAWMVRHEGRVFMLNDRGELIIATLSPTGYSESGRVKLMEPTSTPGARRELGAVLWSHPAFANRHVIVRNDREAARFSLDASDYR